MAALQLLSGRCQTDLEQFVAVVGVTHVVQRAGSAEEVAQALVWLLSEDSSYTTGAVIDVTGGR